MTVSNSDISTRRDVAGPEGLLGFRSVSGLRTADGRRVADLTLFRSATPQFVDGADARRFVDQTGLRQIVDLRLDYEAATEGSGGFDRTDVVIRNIPFAIRAPVAEGSAVAPMPGADPLVATYLGYLNARQAFPELVAAVLADDGLPTLVHCTMGKDRTGVAIAVLLDAVGVLRHDICDNYAQRAEDIEIMMHRLREMASYGDAVDVYPPEALQVDPATILRFLAWIDLRHSGSREWLASVGVSPEQLVELEQRLLEDDMTATSTQVLRSVVLPAAPDEVWALVGDTGGVHRWIPGIASSSVEGGIRTAIFDDGSPAHERIVEHDDKRRTYTYTYLDGPIPLDAYESTITVGPELDGDGALLVWNATLTATPEVVEAVGGLYDGGIARLQEIFASQGHLSK